MTAPETRAGGFDGNARGLVVLAVALVVGFLLLLNAGGGGGGDKTIVAVAPSTTASLDTTAVPQDTTTTTEASTSSRTPSEVKVIVLNGSGQTGAAASVSETIGEGGYAMQTPGNAPSTESTTIYYVEDYEADAVDVASLLGKAEDSVSPLSEASLGGAEGDADVVVVLGADTPPVSSTTTTVPGATTTTTN